MADGVDVESIKSDGEKWFVTLNFYKIENEKKYFWKSFKPIVKIEQRKGNFKITEITWAQK